MTQGIEAYLTNDEKRAHLLDLKREHLIDQVRVQEILPPEDTVQWHFCNSRLKCHRVAPNSHRRWKRRRPPRLRVTRQRVGHRPIEVESFRRSDENDRQDDQ
jgi:hypothetical protein